MRCVLYITCMGVVAARESAGQSAWKVRAGAWWQRLYVYGHVPFD